MEDLFVLLHNDSRKFVRIHAEITLNSMKINDFDLIETFKYFKYLGQSINNSSPGEITILSNNVYIS